MSEQDRILGWFREAYARDAISLGCFEWIVEETLTGAYPHREMLLTLPSWPKGSPERGEFAYDR